MRDFFVKVGTEVGFEVGDEGFEFLRGVRGRVFAPCIDPGSKVVKVLVELVVLLQLSLKWGGGKISKVRSSAAGRSDQRLGRYRHLLLSRCS
jgi:hypothetical protein